jgi:putative transposase
VSQYRRANTPGGSYFFTVVGYRRQPILCDEPIRTALREAINYTQASRPFTIEAWVLLPDHLHCLWTLPEGDADISQRWRMIKRRVSLACGHIYKKDQWLSGSKIKHRESMIWQRRFWEHQILDQKDYSRHVDYIHYNPVKHGLCRTPTDWPYSTLHRYIKAGSYPMNWAVSEGSFGDAGFGE